MVKILSRNATLTEHVHYERGVDANTIISTVDRYFARAVFLEVQKCYK